MPTLTARAAACEAVLGAYKGRALDFRTHDCIRMGSMLLTQLGRPDPLAGTAGYATARGAQRLLKRRGYGDVEGAVQSVGLARIGYASALTADLLALPADGAWGVSLGVYLGGGLALAFGGDGVCAIGSASVALYAWRV